MRDGNMKYSIGFFLFKFPIRLKKKKDFQSGIGRTKLIVKTKDT